MRQECFCGCNLTRCERVDWTATDWGKRPIHRIDVQLGDNCATYGRRRNKLLPEASARADREYPVLATDKDRDAWNLVFHERMRELSRSLVTP